ncbi:CDP-diacylglycerol--glycerol-3-phosphate 3-phosphatidyltransferase [Planctomycetales bacterium]|nr:CDP-diacylglycerol--glycerol-3-phosphate 3-phosphatidyltransferase [Planctomycetales bacterium]
MNVPNTLTILRIVLCFPLFVCIALSYWELALLFFCAASITDFIDGWWARKFHQITVFGRIVDPFADKFLICGTFICLLGVPQLIFAAPAMIPKFLNFQPWMVVVIVARELLITTLRAVIEQSGGDFSAKWIGKWKMGLQCAAVIVCFLYLSFIRYEYGSLPWSLPFGLYVLWLILIWGTVIITLYSGISYTVRAVKVIAGAVNLK